MKKLLSLLLASGAVAGISMAATGCNKTTEIVEEVETDKETENDTDNDVEEDEQPEIEEENQEDEQPEIEEENNEGDDESEVVEPEEPEVVEPEMPEETEPEAPIKPKYEELISTGELVILDAKQGLQDTEFMLNGTNILVQINNGKVYVLAVTVDNFLHNTWYTWNDRVAYNLDMNTLSLEADDYDIEHSISNTDYSNVDWTILENIIA